MNAACAFSKSDRAFQDFARHVSNRVMSVRIFLSQRSIEIDEKKNKRERPSFHRNLLSNSGASC
jgi:hypothetical protein